VSKEIGPRERALREQREARYEESQRQMREQSKADKLDGLKERVAVAAKKTGKSRKAKK
jgi:hypothetical protein